MEGLDTNNNYAHDTSAAGGGLGGHIVVSHVVWVGSDIAASEKSLVGG